MSKQADDYIAAFRRGENFKAPAAGLIAGGQPDSAALARLGKELSAGSGPVRENIVALLVDVGRRVDPLQPKGADVLRNPDIIALLAGPGLAKQDAGRAAAMDALRKLVTKPDLARHGDAFTKALEAAPSEDAFLLVAKARPQNAKAVVDAEASLPKWKNVQAARIARAAFGDAKAEDEFLAAAANAEKAGDGKALAQALGSLALIGTQRSLAAVAERLRTPLTIHIPGAFEKSVRLSALEGLLYNFPDQPMLYPNNIAKEADYTAAERFASQALGVSYKNPPPPFLTYRGYPIPRQ
jgi:hypothetical protein